MHFYQRMQNSNDRSETSKPIDAAPGTEAEMWLLCQGKRSEWEDIPNLRRRHSCRLQEVVGRGMWLPICHHPTPNV